MAKAIMADSMIQTLIGINAMGTTSWKYNPNNKEHRKLYEPLVKAKAAIEMKYKNKCELKEMTAAQLPAYKSLVVRMVGAIPIWPKSLFNKFKDVPVVEPKVVQKVTDAEAKVIDSDLAKKLQKIQELYELVRPIIEKNAVDARANAKVEDQKRKEKYNGQTDADLLKQFSFAISQLPTVEQLAKKEEEEESAKKGQEKTKPGEIRSLLDVGPPGTLEAGKKKAGKVGNQGSAAGKSPVELIYPVLDLPGRPDLPLSESENAEKVVPGQDRNPLSPAMLNAGIAARAKERRENNDTRRKGVDPLHRHGQK
ncbi:hypothetical protein Ddc_20238 [Ditylenchus destructor]|nr:hypothetical protein Ddc_20238 [Ditylenchus destructor]